MFMNTTKPDRSADEGIVAQIDPIRKLCRVKTLSGQNLNSVRWTETCGGSGRAGDRSTPNVGDHVYLDYRLGYPIVAGYLPKVQSSENAFPLVIDSGSFEADTGNFSSGGQATWADQNKPKEMLDGDRVIATDGGAMLALLRYGTAIVKASPLAQVIVSKIDDTVRIVSRNFEHYTDVGSDVIRNIGGRVYRYISYTNNFGSSRNGSYQYSQFIGDTALAEAVKDDYLLSSSAAATTVIFKEQVKQGSHIVERSLTLDGTETVSISDGATHTTRTSTAGQMVLDFNAQNKITVNNDLIKLERSDGATVTMTPDGITMVYQNGTINMHDAGVDTLFGSHYVKVNNGGVQLG